MITEFFHDTFLFDRIEYLPERYLEILLRRTLLNLKENNQILKKLNLSQ